MGGEEQIPWRGPGPGRPDLAIPPARMPLRSRGQTRKRWRYVGFYGPELMLCAARAQVGPFGQCFWALWDREGDRSFANTRLRPGSTEVKMDGPQIEIEARGLRARLELGESAPVEAICPSGSGWGWTRKRAGVPIKGTIETPERRWEVDGHGVDDQSAGYQQRRTSWHWSAGIGRATDGQPLAWNLVEGINDPPASSERAIWVGGEPSEPDPVSFVGLEGVEFSGGTKLDFTAGSERVRDDNFLLFRSSYRHRFGEFHGSLDGVELAEGFGVMEQHDAVW
ncbi:MAG TPA: DUF2804 family protein [Solirubrobacterales bacterium]|nr:DUF2804 family protein [Solirubrobacterales bacterium]